ncbi:MAG TPA: DUF4974 domain-containing protein, partial [Pirellulales bacterium]
MRRRGTLLVLSSLATVLAICPISSPTAAAGPYDPIWVNPASANRAAMLKVLDEAAELQFDKTPLGEVIEKIKARYHVSVQVRGKALEEAGVTLDLPVTFKLKGATLRQALDLMLGQLELTWLIRNDGLIVTTVSESETLTEPVIYPVEDLLFPPAELRVPGRKYAPDYASLSELITSTVNPTTWEVSGDPIHRFPGAIVVPQTARIQERIADMFAELRAVRDAQFAPTPNQPAAPLKSSTQRLSDAVYAALGKPVQLDLLNVNLAELAEQISSQCKILAVVDSRSLEEAGIKPDKIRFTRKLRNIRLSKALKLLLDDLKLAAAVHDGMLLITSESESERLLETRVYPIRSLGSRTAVTPHRRLKQEYETLCELSTVFVDPRSWVEAGGNGMIRQLASAGALVVSQSTRAHLKLEQSLEALRKLCAEHPGDPSSNEPAEDELIVFAYRLPRFYARAAEQAPAKADKPESGAGASAAAARGRTLAQILYPDAEGGIAPAADADREQIAQQYAAALPKLVEPESWGSGRGSIEVVGELLFIRQRMAVHEQVSKFLSPNWWPVERAVESMGGISGPYDPIWFDPVSANRAGVLKILDEAAELQFDKTPLKDA